MAQSLFDDSQSNLTEYAISESSGAIKAGRLAMAALKLGMYGDQLRAEPSEVEALISGSGREVMR